MCAYLFTQTRGVSDNRWQAVSTATSSRDEQYPTVQDGITSVLAGNGLAAGEEEQASLGTLRKKRRGGEAGGVKRSGLEWGKGAGTSGKVFMGEVEWWSAGGREG